METKFRSILEQAIINHIFPGGVVGIVDVDGTRTVVSAGNFTYETSSPSVHEDTIYDTASITKSIPTACLALALIDEGRLSLGDQLVAHLPEFSGRYREEVKIKHLLTYTLPYHIKNGERMSDFLGRPVKELERAIFAKGPDAPPGTELVYTNRGAFFLGLVLGRITGKPLHELAREVFFGPLAMKSTTFFPETLLRENIAPSEQDEDGADIRGVVHDESARVFRAAGRTVGQAGLFSTVPNLLIFMEMLLRGGELGGRRYFTEQTVGSMATNQVENINGRMGLGWELNSSSFMGKYANEHMFGKTGFTGARIVADVEKKRAMVLLANRIYPKRPCDSAAFNAVSADLCDLIFEQQNL